MNLELKDYQKEAIEKALASKKYALLLPTGTGKTLCALVYLKILDVKAIVLTKASIRHVWAEENKKFNLGLDVSLDKTLSHKISVVSYDTVKIYPEMLDEYQCIVIDEAISFADPETNRSQVLGDIIKKKDRVLLLAGYPVENRLAEIYYLHLITDVLGTNWYAFMHRYFNLIKKPGTNVIMKAIPKMGAFNQIVELIKPYVYLVDKSEIVEDVKSELFVVRYELSDYQKNLIKTLSEFGHYSDGKVDVTCKSDLAVYSKVMQIVSGFIYNTSDETEKEPVFFDENPKLDKLRELVAGKSNYILWYWFQAEQEILKEFKDCRLSKLQTDCRGLNLQHMDFAVYFTIPLSGGMFMQSVDRIFRLGRKENVSSIVFAPTDEFGDKFLAMLDRKHKLTKNFMRSLLESKV